MRTQPSGRRVLAALAATTLLFSLAAPVAAAPVPIANVTFDPDAELDPQTNLVTVHGTVECLAAGSVEMYVEAFQTIGQANIHGTGFGDRVCTGADPTPVPWSAEIFPDNSPFNPGTIDLFVFNPQCGIEGCVEMILEATVEARPTNNRPPPPPPPPPSNDEASGATPIGFGTVTADTSAATTSETDVSCPLVQPFVSHTLWYSFTAASSGWVAVATMGSDFDTTLHVVDEAGAVVACNDDIVPGEIRQSQLVFHALEGATYLIQVGSWEFTRGGNLVLTLAPGAPPPDPEPAPANDSRSAPAVLSIDGAAVTQSTTGATANAAEDPADGDCGFPINGATVWYSLTAIAGGWVSIDTFGSDYDTTLVVYDAGGSIIGCNDQAQNTNQSQLTIGVEAGETYLVMVGSWAGQPGGSLTIQAATADAPLTAEIIANPIGSLAPGSGDVTLTGSITCSEPASGTIFVFLEQAGGRFVASSGAELEVTCGPEATPLSVVVPSPGPKFQAGEAFAFAEVHLVAGAKEFFTFVEGPIRLRPAGSIR